ncbi:MAG: DUF4238 domain-containing protein [Sphingomonadales bacterium]
MSQPKKNHYNPAFYLRSWAEQDGKIPCYRLINGKIAKSRRSPENTGFEIDLYSLKNVPENKRQELESSFFNKEIDNKAAPIFQKLINGHLEELSSREKEKWTHYLVAQRLRIPESIHEVRKRGSLVLKAKLLENPEDFLEIKGTEKEKTLLDWVDKNFVGLLDNFGMLILPSIITDQTINKKISEMHWWVQDFSRATVPLLTSDRPLWIFSGVADPNCVIGLPLSPTKMFFAAYDLDVKETFRRKTENYLVRLANRTLILQAKERIYGRATTSFIEKTLKGKSPTPRG